MSYITVPIQYCVDWPIRSVGVWIHSITDIDSIIEENKYLKHELITTKSKLQRLDVIIKENQELRKLLHDDITVNNDKVILGNLLAVNISSSGHQYVINKGKSHGVQLGQIALDSKGVVGQVINVYSLVSEIMLITDSASAIPVQNKRNGIRGIIVGNSAKRSLSLVNLPADVDIRENDQFVTSGLDGHFPFGYYVGSVNKIDRTSGAGFADIELKPISLLNRLRYVLILSPTARKKS